MLALRRPFLNALARAQGHSPHSTKLHRLMASAKGEKAPAEACQSGGEMLGLPRWVVVGRSSNAIVQQLIPHLETRGRVVQHIDPYVTTDAGSSAVDALAGEVDVVDLCAKPSLGLQVVEKCKVLGIKNVFIQPGAGSAEIEQACGEAGIAFHHGCVLRDLE
eukprot:TRINITY_DN32187_c1_g1_i2.p1 TRINITY_DN32187_c1_g1~~TRINITY_DN32187_c1_g1_i2.p1  ORF type:complete len:162 (+),score=28.44 TRINITY_DN32187_c1_g1_i2:57-542(+)